MTYSRDEILTKLKTARDQILDLIVKVTVNPKPSYSIDGESVSWESYLSTLNERLDALTQRIAYMENAWHQSQAFT